MADQQEAMVAAQDVPQRDRVGELVRRARTWWDGIQEHEQERHLPFTVLAVLGIALLGLVVVPLSIPDPLPEPDPGQVMAERYLLAFAAPGAPTLAQGLKAPSSAEVMKTYGTDGGTACTGTLKDAYDTLVTTTASGGTAFDKAGFATMKVAHSVYCPDRTPKFAQFVQRRSALNARAARARAADAA